MADTVKAQLSALYQAGKVDFPERAAELSSSLGVIAGVHADWSGPTVRAGSPAALTQAMAINETVYDRLHRAVLSWQDASHALTAIADDLVATDQRAADAADAVHFDLDELPAPSTPVPPTFDEAQG